MCKNSQSILEKEQETRELAYWILEQIMKRGKFQQGGVREVGTRRAGFATGHPGWGGGPSLPLLLKITYARIKHYK